MIVDMDAHPSELRNKSIQNSGTKPLSGGDLSNPFVCHGQIELRAVLAQFDLDRSGLATICIFVAIDEKLREHQPERDRPVRRNQYWRQAECHVLRPLAAHEGKGIRTEFLNVAGGVDNLYLIPAVEPAMN